MTKKPNLVAFDLDGTLAESKQPLTPEMGQSLARLLDRMPVAVMSGAGLLQFKEQFLAHLPPSANLAQLYIFPDSAAQCFVYKEKAGEMQAKKDWQAVYDLSFTEAEKKQVLDALGSALITVGLASAPARIWGERVEDRGGEIAFSPLGQQAPVPEKQAWHEAHEDTRQELRNLLAAKLPDFAVTTGGMTTIDITRKGITKAYGIEQLATLAGTLVSQMLYVGDALQSGGNDAVVIVTGVPTYAVTGPADTAQLIQELLEDN